jgi:hypothetical protein
MPILGIALTLASLGAQAFGAAKSAQANNALRNKLLQKSDSLDAVFNRDYNMDYMATPGVKNLMASYQNGLKEVGKNAEGRAVMAGSSPEAVIAEKEKINQNFGDFTRKVAAGADAFRQQKEQNYLIRRDAMDNKIMANDQQKASQWDNLMNNAANLGVAGISADSILKNKVTPDNPYQAEKTSDYLGRILKKKNPNSLAPAPKF